MPNWGAVLQEINRAAADRQLESPHDLVRRKYLKKLSEHTGRNVIAYYSGFLTKPGVEGVEIVDDDKNGLMMAVHELNHADGLDLILHTPGGQIAATESQVHYLKQIYGKNIRAIVPGIAMSAGTIIACSCQVILMGKHSNLGPTDPQVQGIPAVEVKAEFERAYQEIKADQAKALVWSPILRRYPPTFLAQCDYAVTWSRDFVEQCLLDNMFSNDSDGAAKAKQIAKELSDLSKNKGHNKHLHLDDCRALGLKVEALEDDDQLQDLVLTVHHCFMHSMSNTTALKIIENHLGRAVVKHAPQNTQLSQLIGLRGPA